MFDWQVEQTSGDRVGQVRIRQAEPLMSEIPSDLKYARSHEWARLEEDGTVTVGITDHAQGALGDVVFVEHPEIDQPLVAEAEAGVVESVKAASDIYAPVSGKVIAVNTALEDAPEQVNQDPYGDGWFFKLQPDDAADLEELMSAEEYGEFLESQPH
jgi:glycine cleavage system H protein